MTERMALRMALWTVYDHPLDHPGHFVARRWEVRDQDGASMVCMTDSVIQSVDLDMLRSAMEQMGLCRLERAPEDDPSILETWL